MPAARRRTEAQARSGQPVVRRAPLGELNVYEVHEHELDQLAGGSPGPQLLNISYALLGAAVTLSAAGLAVWSAQSVRTFWRRLDVSPYFPTNGPAVLPKSSQAHSGPYGVDHPIAQ